MAGVSGAAVESFGFVGSTGLGVSAGFGVSVGLAGCCRSVWLGSEAGAGVDWTVSSGCGTDTGDSADSWAGAAVSGCAGDGLGMEAAISCEGEASTTIGDDASAGGSVCITAGRSGGAGCARKPHPVTKPAKITQTVILNRNRMKFTLSVFPNTHLLYGPIGRIDTEFRLPQGSSSGLTESVSFVYRSIRDRKSSPGSSMMGITRGVIGRIRRRN